MSQAALPQLSAKKIIIVCFCISAVAIAFLMWILYARPSLPLRPEWSTYLPAMNALFNGLSALCIILGVRAIKRDHRCMKSRIRHQRYMLMSFMYSAFFLVGYVLYHFFHGETRFQGEGMIRTIYFFILITHILLSFPTLPMVLTTFGLAFGGHWEEHKKWARKTWLPWLYVSVTGVVIFFMLKS
jgi:putative membrane protein